MNVCDKCGRKNLKKASMVASAGKTSVKGVGGGTGGLGLGYAETTTNLAKKSGF
tara:strand:- start:134 stop:295 length:162 start_codon:yes stop_codon:yes gene_type:complete